MKCGHCGNPIRQVTMTGVTVWTHVMPYGGTPVCPGGGGKRATPEAMLRDEVQR